MQINFIVKIIVIVIVCNSIRIDPQTNLTNVIHSLVQERSLKGIQLEITKNDLAIFHLNQGYKNTNNTPIDSSTKVRVASLSKSITSIALLQLIEQNLLKLTTSINQILGFKVTNPYFPTINITVQMLLSHQSSLIQCEPYYNNFLLDTYNAKYSQQIPHLSDILTEQGSYYNSCLFSDKYQPGSHFQYTNLNYGIAGTLVEIVSGIRFDVYTQKNILDYLIDQDIQPPTFNPAEFLKNQSNLATIFQGQNGTWVPSYDYYNSTIPIRNMSHYIIGTNGLVFSPQGGLRASVTNLNNYMSMIRNKGRTKNNYQILTQSSISQLIQSKYQYHGIIGGSMNDFHLYGLGIYTTSYWITDNIIPHEIVKGHIGNAYGLISAYYYWKQYTFSYYINGALYGYKYDTNTIYEYQRITIHNAIYSFISSLSQKIQQI